MTTQPPSEPVTFRAGDTMSYRSVTQGHVVTWTRDEAGKWWPDDFIERGATASDDDVRVNMGIDTLLNFDPADRVLTVRQSDDPAQGVGGG